MATERPRRAAYDAWLDEPLAGPHVDAEDIVTDTAAGDQATDHDRECRNCGAVVSTEWARVNGDNEGRVHACIECSTNRDIKRGAVADAIAGDKP